MLGRFESTVGAMAVIRLYSRELQKRQEHSFSGDGISSEQRNEEKKESIEKRDQVNKSDECDRKAATGKILIKIATNSHHTSTSPAKALTSMNVIRL
jgi:hypothetical protein